MKIVHSAFLHKNSRFLLMPKKKPFQNKTTKYILTYNVMTDKHKSRKQLGFKEALNRQNSQR